MVLALKLLLTPFFIASVSLAGRRWGPGVSGLLIGLPLTSGPISLILASQYGVNFAAQAAIGTLLGQASVCIFCLAYTLAARRMDWPGSALLASAAYLAATLVWDRFAWSLAPALALLVVIIVLVLRGIPRQEVPLNTTRLPGWDLPARMVLATAFVFLLTTFANLLGPQLSGLLSPFPVFGCVLAAFAHHQQGPRAATNFLRGVVLGAWAFTSFFTVVGGLLPALGIGWTYAFAALAAVGVNLIFLVRAGPGTQIHADFRS